MLRRRRLVREALAAVPGERVLDVGCGPSFYVAELLEYVPDPAAALAELRRTLRPGGRLVVWDVDWSTVSWHAADQARMCRVLRAWDGHLADPCLPRTLAAKLRAAGFVDVRAEGHTFASTELDPDTYGTAILPLIRRYVAGRDAMVTDSRRG